MLVITRHAEEKLAAYLGHIRDDTLAWRVIAFAHTGPPDDPANRNVRVNLVSNMVKESGMDEEAVRLFFFDDGSVTVMCRGAKREMLEHVRRGFLEMFPAIAAQAANLKLYDLSIDYSPFKEHCEALLRAVRVRDDELRRKTVTPVKPRPILADITQARHALAGRAQRKGLYVQLADDEPFTLKLVESILGGHKVMTSTDGVEAVETYLLNAPDILFLDINMPEMDGHAVLQRVLAFDPDAFVVMLTGDGTRDTVVRAVQNGARGFVTKPFTKDKLLKYLDIHQKERTPS